MDTFVEKSFYPWCVFSILFFVFMVGMSFTIRRYTLLLFLPFVLGLLLLLCLLTLTLSLPACRRFLPAVLPWLCIAILALVAWSAHGTVSQLMANARDLSLVRTLALLDGNPEAEAELVGFVRAQVSDKVWYLLLLVMEINVDVLRMTGTVHNSLHVHFTPLVGILVATCCSEQISNSSLYTLIMAAVFMVHTLTSSIHMLGMLRERFRFDYQLRQQLAQEAAMAEVAKDVEVAQ
eukprot:EG_transcript_28084